MSTTLNEVQPCTDEQIAEWSALHDQARVLADARDKARWEAGAWLSWSIENPGHEEYATSQAMAEAQRAVDLWAERAAVCEQIDAHPYTAVVAARRAAQEAGQ